ncbi:antitoxin VapB family protein [Natrinema gelatinilyticum]|uniref:antitoxin VapB family protein n=1 Tax=Natrinema gelatinilyticum TaxID=2961571 RepID=UPI0020C25D6B|nr:antitoxin VapB family protein [Natrinema gelatinilyticum]
MGAATEQIRVSDSVKREIERRRREGESYNDVLERVFRTDRDRDRDLLAGAGFWSTDEAEEFRENRRAAKEESKERMRRGSNADR